MIETKNRSAREQGVVLLAVTYWKPGGAIDDENVKLQWATCAHYAEKHGMLCSEQTVIVIENPNHAWKQIEETIETFLNGPREITDVLIRRDARFPFLTETYAYLRKKKVGLIEVPINYEPGYHDSPPRKDLQYWLNLIGANGKKKN